MSNIFKLGIIILDRWELLCDIGRCHSENKG